MIFAVIVLGLVVGVLLILVGRLDKKRKFAEYGLAELHNQLDGVMAVHLDLIQRYERVQHGYDQGVLEGMRQAYVNVRATVSNELFSVGAPGGPYIRSFIVPLLENLGQRETRLLDEMKGITKAREEFDKALISEPAVNMFPGNNKPQIAQPVEEK